uniref:Coiled-coil domain containing 191 n=1 Tax=Oncorhynchus kisutch TaxID=8019 RepID=A0A8C7M7Z5_ONCKI
MEMASYFALTEVFSLKKAHSGISSQTMALKNTEQLLDHDELRLELEIEEDVIVSPEKNSPAAMAPAQPVSLDYSNFDDLYSHLAEEEESSVVNIFLQDLMEWEVVDSGIVQDLALDSEDDWRWWCRAERGRQELFAQQEETRYKIASLINAVATGKLKAPETPAPEQITALPETFDQSQTTELVSNGQLGAVVQPTLPWQVTRRHAALSGDELRRARQRGAVPRSRSAELRGGRFERRHASQQQTITVQRRLLREQQEQIARLQEMGLKQEAQIAQFAVPAAQGPRGMTSDHKEPSGGCGIVWCPKRCIGLQTGGIREAIQLYMKFLGTIKMCLGKCNSVQALNQSTALFSQAQLKAAEEERQKEEEEQKRRAAERRREEKRQEREREQENQRRFEREQQLQTQAQQHYHRTLLLRRGMAPWKHRVAMSQANTQLARAHHRQSLLKRCILSWQQVTGESLAQKWASAKQLHQHILLRRSLGNWKRLKDHRMVVEGRADRFWRMHTLRRALIALLDHVTQERMVEWDRELQAQGHSDRRAVRSCFQAWRQYPGWLREERERETRREKLRRRVAEVLPDFRSSPLSMGTSPAVTHTGRQTENFNTR